MNIVIMSFRFIVCHKKYYENILSNS